MTIEVPCATNEFLQTQSVLLLDSFSRLTGRDLIDSGLDITDRCRALYEAPFCVVSHNTNVDPVFNYGNKMALAQFEMNWDDFTKLPSRLSAEPQVREERERLLSQVSEKGFVDDYRGVRVSSTGRRFMVEDAIVWNLMDADGRYCGQAAVLYKWSDL